MEIKKIKEFNTTGPCNQDDHYMLPALPRLPDVRNLIDSKKYYVLHAPRQCGKTTSVKACVKKINEEGDFYALYCSLEEFKGATDKLQAMDTLIGNLVGSLKESPVEALNKAGRSGFWNKLKTEDDYIASKLKEWLKALSKRLDKDFIIFFDEYDSLFGETLLSFMSQLRNGYVKRDETPFPRSIILIGMRNIRDLKIHIRYEVQSLGSSSPFNIITE
ncbi:MAG: AAA family ATPase [Deltaproteobacteria bacterium]|jgi:AAA+ ATPase superfamily predicted ATPase|nr:AAA family ATPase [Deltaproteobacteria bacterium]